MGQDIQSGIYQIRNKVNGKVYIGSAKNIKARWIRHRKDLTHGKHHSRHMQSAWDKYGADAFVFEIIEIVDDENNLVGREQSWIDQIASFERSHGYNTCRIAGSSIGFKFSDESRAKISAYAKKRIFTRETREKMAASRRGKSVSTEARAKISASQKGKGKPKASPEVRARKSAHLMVLWRDPAYREKMIAAYRDSEARRKASESSRGRKQRPEAIAKTAAKNRGRKQTPEEKARRSVSARGRICSSETRAKMSAAQKARYESVRLAKSTVSQP